MSEQATGQLGGGLDSDMEGNTGNPNGHPGGPPGGNLGGRGQPNGSAPAPRPGAGVDGDCGTDGRFAALFNDRYAELTRLAYVMTGDADLAQDLAQDTFVRALPHLDRLRSAEAAPAYLRTTLVNLVRQRYRRRMLEWRHPQPVPDPVPAPDDDRSTALDLARLVRTLPIRRRACVVLRFYADMSEQETADVLGISVGTVKSQTHRALRALAEQLADEAERAGAGQTEPESPRRANRG